MSRSMNVRRRPSAAPGLLFALAGLAATAAPSLAQDRSWNGGSGPWSDASRWTPADIPDNTGENALLSAAGSYTVRADGGFNLGFLSLTNPTGRLDINNAARLSLAAGITNNSTITINDTAGINGTYMQFLTSQTITGSGSLVLNANSGNLDTAYLYYNGGGEVVTHAAGHTIRGTGNVYVRIDNAGTLNADASGRTLRLNSQPKSNSNLMTATASGTLLVESIGITQSGPGRIVANGGTVQFLNAGVSFGAVTTTSGATNITGTNNFDGVTFSGPISVLNNSNMRLINSAPTVNNGTITVNPSAGPNSTYIQCLGHTSLSGSGSIILNADPGNLDTAILYYNGGGEILTHAATHTIRGVGSIYVNTINDGLISADQSAKILRLNSQPKTNNGTMQAVNGGLLDIISVGVTQGPSGVIRANGGRVRTGGASISGGAVIAQGAGGIVETTAGTTDLIGATLSGPMNVNNNTALRTTATGFTNNGTITINPAAGANATYFQALATSTISGTGTIILNAQPTNLDTAYLTYNGGGEILTLGSGQTVRGVGRIYVNTANNGLISADVTGNVLQLVSQPKTNNNIMRAINGAFLDINVGVAQAPAASILADGGTVRLTNASVTNGNVTAQNAGIVETAAGTTDLIGVTLSGPFNVNNNTNLRTNATGFVNNGTITINPTAGPNVTTLQALATTTISGNGSIVLNAQPANLDTAYLVYNGGGEILTLGSGQTLRGVGRIYVNTANNGVIHADQTGKILHLVSQPKTNNNIMKATNNAFLDITVGITQGSSGVILADGGHVRLAAASVSGGNVQAQNAGGLIEITGTTDFNNLTLSGPLEVNAGMSFRSTTGFVNNGTITVNPTAANTTTIFQTLGSNTISGNGTIRLNANPANIDTAYLLYNGGGEVLTLTSGQTLTGFGRIYTRTVMNGRLAPGNGFASIGQIDTRQSLTLADSSTLDIEIGGTNPNQYDRITGAGNLILQNGTIRITTANGFTPAIGQSFDIVSGPTVSGQFCGHIFARGFSVAYLGNIIRVTYGGCVADVDGGSGCGIPDGGVTIDDLLFYLDLFAAGDINADVDDGSFTGTVDGGVTIDDLLYFLTRFQDGC